VTGGRTSPQFTPGEYRADAVVHGLGLVAGPVFGLWLVLSAAAGGATTGVVLALAVYALAMVGMLAGSAAYNMARRPALKEWLRRLDHAGIYVAIAGTYTPLLLRLPTTMLVAVALTVVWAVAGLGIGLKLLAPRRFERLGLALYVGLGWIGLPLVPTLSGRLHSDAGLLIAVGCLIYTAGVGPYLLERLRYHNVVWHAMVLVAAACHGMAMWAEFVTAP